MNASINKVTVNGREFQSRSSVPNKGTMSVEWADDMVCKKMNITVKPVMSTRCGEHVFVDVNLDLLSM